MYMYQSSPHKKNSNTMENIRLNSLENLTPYYLWTCRIVVNFKVWEIGRRKQAAGQSRSSGRVMWTKCLLRDTVLPMEAALRNSNEIICKNRKLHLQVPWKVFRESRPSISSCWLAEQDVRGLIPGLTATISEIGCLLLPSPSPDMPEIMLKRHNPQNSQPTNKDINN